MNLEKAKYMCGNHPTWVLRNMIRALSSMNLLNTEEENLRLEAAKIVLKERYK